MLKSKRFDKPDAQIMVEYTLVIGLVVIMLITMLPVLSRMSQSMMKVVVDQVGNQVNGEQEFGESGHVVSDYASTRSNVQKDREQFADIITYHYNDITMTDKSSLINLGMLDAPDR